MARGQGVKISKPIFETVSKIDFFESRIDFSVIKTENHSKDLKIIIIRVVGSVIKMFNSEFDESIKKFDSKEQTVFVLTESYLVFLTFGHAFFNFLQNNFIFVMRFFCILLPF